MDNNNKKTPQKRGNIKYGLGQTVSHVVHNGFVIRSLCKP